MPKGLPKSYIKKYGISKLAWKKFRAGALTGGIRTRTRAIKRRIRRSRRKPRHNPTKKVRRLVRRRRGRSRGGKSITRTAFKLIRLGALAGPAMWRIGERGFTPAAAEAMIHDYTGINMADGSWNIARMARGWGPYIGACLATYGIPKAIGIIRRL